MIDKAMLGAGPQVQRDQNYESARKGDAKTVDVNFDELMMNSSAEIATKREQEKVTNGGKEIRIGESKSDVEFREQLEKISGKKQAPRKGQLDKDDFLTLMVTQLKYQDPTKPQETNEMATQLAQFNSVEQLVHMNKTIGDMVKAQNELRSDKLTQYIGMDVQVSSDKIKLQTDGTLTDAFFELPIPSSSTAVAIKNTDGKVVRYLTLGATDSGSQKIKWDGLDDKGQKAAPGAYTFSVTAATVEGKPIQAKTSVTARVNAVTNLADGGKLDTAAGPMDPKNILAVRAPTQASTPNTSSATATPNTTMASAANAPISMPSKEITSKPVLVAPQAAETGKKPEGTKQATTPIRKEAKV